METKKKWTIDDYEHMDWNGARMYGFIFPDKSHKIQFEIDYIFDINNSHESSNFLVSPCQLIFYDVSNLNINLAFNNFMQTMISEIKIINRRLTPNGKMSEFDFFIEADTGFFEFSATGFEQSIKKAPKIIKFQDLDRSVSFY